MARGSIQKRQSAKGMAYWVRVEYAADPTTGERRQRSETFRLKKDAEAALAKWLAEIDRGTAVDTTRQTVGEFLTHWLDTVAAYRVRPTTLEDYRYTVERQIIPALGSIPVQRLTAAHVQAFYAEKRAAGCGARTVQLCHLRLSQALKQGVRWGTVTRNVCDAVDAPRSKAKPGKTWTPGEARQFLAGTEGDALCPLWSLALTTGARQGELLGVRWQDLDFDRATLTIRQAVAVHKGRVIIQEPKSRAALRTIALPVESVAALRAHRVRQATARLATADAYADHDLVFATALGTPVHPSNVLRAFYRLIERTGVPRITFHGLRHTHATWLIANGTPITTVSERLGHAKSSITLDTYAHVVARTRDEAALAISGLLFGPDAAPVASVGT